MQLKNRLNLRKKLRARRARAKFFGTSQRPRLSVFRSNKFIYVQLIDDENGKTLVAAKSDKSEGLGQEIAKKAKELKIDTVVFDRGSYQYHGRVKAVADGAREGGLKF